MHTLFCISFYWFAFVPAQLISYSSPLTLFSIYSSFKTSIIEPGWQTILPLSTRDQSSTRNSTNECVFTSNIDRQDLFTIRMVPSLFRKGKKPHLHKLLVNHYIMWCGRLYNLHTILSYDRRQVIIISWTPNETKVTPMYDLSIRLSTCIRKESIFKIFDHSLHSFLQSIMNY